MTTSIVLVIIAFVVAVAAIVINPKRDDSGPVFKLRPLGYILIAILLIFASFQIFQILDDNKLQRVERSILVAKNKSDSIFQQQELEARKALLTANEKVIKTQKTSIEQQNYIVELQKTLIDKYNSENSQIRKQLITIQDMNKRLGYKVKPFIDLTIFIPISDYSISRQTKYKIPLIKKYFLDGMDTVTVMSPDFEYFTDSIYLGVLNKIFGHDILMSLKINKSNSGKDWIYSICRVKLLNNYASKGLQFIANWDADLTEDIKDKSDNRKVNVDVVAYSEGNDIWGISVNLYNVPINIQGLNPDLSILDLIEKGTLFEIQHNCSLLDLNYHLTFRGNNNRYLFKLPWQSIPIDKEKSYIENLFNDSEEFIVKSSPKYNSSSELQTLKY